MMDVIEPSPTNRSSRPRRSSGQIAVARALWYVRPGIAELRTERLGPLPPGEARVAARYSAISRGTERLVSRGEVPKTEWDRMRAPMQSGDFPFPVKYGYSAVGRVTAGSEALVGKTVFALHPHQDHFQVAEAALLPLPTSVTEKRATLAALMETALNAHWDAGTAPGDSVLVVGAGALGLLTAHLARRIAGVRASIVDVDPSRREIAAQLGLAFTTPSAAPSDNRIVFHTSATSEGLQCAIDAAAFEGRIIEMSWFGDKSTNLHLGGVFHSRRLRIISSQVGAVAPNRRAGVTRRARLAAAIGLLDDPALDVLVSDEVAFDDVVELLPDILSGARGGLAPIIRYG